MRYLSLGSNSIGTEGAEAIALALRSNATLCALDMSVNEIGDKGGIFFAEMLRVR